MSASDPRTRLRGRPASVVRTLAIPVAVLLARAVCAVTLLALSVVTVPEVRALVEAARTDQTITDGMGSYAEAPEGWEFHVCRLNVTNEGSSPAIFDSSGTVATTPTASRSATTSPPSAPSPTSWSQARVTCDPSDAA